MKKNITCTICGGALSGKQSVFCSISCKNRSNQSYQAQQARGLKRKVELVERFGGKCLSCGYGKNLSALTFHHLDPKMKSFQLDLRSLSNRKKSQIESEVRKCTLICHNCHAELHNPKHSLE